MNRIHSLPTQSFLSLISSVVSLCNVVLRDAGKFMGVAWNVRHAPTLLTGQQVKIESRRERHTEVISELMFSHRFSGDHHRLFLAHFERRRIFIEKKKRHIRHKRQSTSRGHATMIPVCLCRQTKESTSVPHSERHSRKNRLGINRSFDCLHRWSLWIRE